jgi:hypothetical protein
MNVLGMHVCMHDILGTKKYNYLYYIMKYYSVTHV